MNRSLIPATPASRALRRQLLRQNAAVDENRIPRANHVGQKHARRGERIGLVHRFRFFLGLRFINDQCAAAFGKGSGDRQLALVAQAV